MARAKAARSLSSSLTLPLTLSRPLALTLSRPLALTLKRSSALTLTLTLSFTLLSHTVYSQDFNEPQEILNIIQKSSLKYEVLEVNTLVAEPVVHNLHNLSTMYSEVTEGQPSIGMYEVDATIRPLFEKAEADYVAGRYPAAKDKYLQIHELRPDLANVMTYIGQCYFEEGHRKEAINWYREAIKANYHGYMAHWYLADNLHALGELDEASKEIALAWVLNRNSEDVLNSLTIIFKADHRHFEDFVFAPNYTLEKEGDAVRVRFSENWMMYAFCKALWAYEPGYHRELGGGRSEFDFVQEKECLLNLVIDYQRLHGKKKSKDAAINALRLAFETQSVNEFIFMEQWLPTEPAIIYTQPQLAIEDLVQYVLKVRAPKK